MLADVIAPCAQPRRQHGRKHWLPTALLEAGRRHGVACESDSRAEDGPDRPEVGGVGRQGDGRPDGEHDDDHGEVRGEVGAQSATGRGDAGGAPAGIVAPDAIERQAGEQFVEFVGGLRLEHGL